MYTRNNDGGRVKMLAHLDVMSTASNTSFPEDLYYGEPHKLIVKPSARHSQNKNASFETLGRPLSLRFESLLTTDILTSSEIFFWML